MTPTHPVVPVVLLLTLLASLVGCGGGDTVVLTIMDTQKNRIAGVEARLVGDNRLLDTTDARGEATLELPGNTEARVRLVPPPGLENSYRFTETITVDADDRDNGRKLVRWEAGDRREATTATLRVTSEPAGAVIRLGGADYGATDTVLRDLPVGRVQLVLDLEGMHPDTVDMFLVAGENTYHRRLLPLEVTTASLLVQSFPAGAAVTLNGKATGESTPATFTDLAPGRYRVSVSRSGYRTFETRVTLAAGKEGTVHAGNLEEKGAVKSPAVPVPAPTAAPTPPTRTQFTVKPYPGYAEVYVDDDPVNRNQTGAFVITLAEGLHTFHVVNRSIDSRLTYTVTRDDPNRVLLLNYEQGRVEARP